MSSSLFTVRAIALIRSIPLGKVTTYGTIASMAGNRRAARQVARLLHSSSRKERLPWHRVVNREGKISLAPQQGYENQKQLLENEGVTFDASDRINLAMYLWHTD
ncbi:MGMT family protein [uncultured Pseudodesulfovibrio sp.]|uniref:MGMT family protein n=1 Tax=uncultured Pseudodesulfovibrio sp. TaxID=2035858 RepID=UPI0029C98384|nr:MGMT family protein [uncultured Pseudodesulfovibrio sp.]